MAASVNTYSYLRHLASRWRWIAASCGIAAGVALAAGLMAPSQYTATCRILVQPPSGADLRGATGISPIYLESLRTYEHFAASDSLFLRALDQFHLRQRFPGWPIESLKDRILKVGMVRDTKILEIGVTLSDAKTAHALAVYLGEETVELSRAADREGGLGATQGLEKDAADARARLDRTEAAWSRFTTQQPVELLQQNLESEGELRSSLRRQLMSAELSAPASAAVLRQQLARVDHELEAQEGLLARRLAERDRLDVERNAAQEAYAAIEQQVSQAQGELGNRGERLQIIDPGIVPERPSAPNIPLHVLAALMLGLIVPVIYLTLELSYRTLDRT